MDCLHFRSLVASTDRVNGQNVTSQVQEEFVLRNENGAWRIDQVTHISQRGGAATKKDGVSALVRM